MEGKEVFNIIATVISVSAAVLSAAAVILRVTRKPEEVNQPNPGYCYYSGANSRYYNGQNVQRPYHQQTVQYVAPAPAPAPMPTPQPTQTFSSQELKWSDGMAVNNDVYNQTMSYQENPWSSYTNNVSWSYYNGYDFNNPNYGYGYDQYQQPFVFNYSNYIQPQDYNYGYQMNYGYENYGDRQVVYDENISVPGYDNQSWGGKKTIDIDAIFGKYEQKQVAKNQNSGGWECVNNPKPKPLTDDDDGIVPMFTTPDNNIVV